jgi:hypothetical protein
MIQAGEAGRAAEAAVGNYPGKSLDLVHQEMEVTA